MILWIDDVRTAPQHYDFHARSSWSAITWMQQHGCPKFISFDHDLGGDDTSMKVIHWMVKQDMDNPGWLRDDFSYAVHSANPVGVQNIVGLIEGYLNAMQDDR